MKLNRRALMNKKLFLNAVMSLAISTAFATNIHAASDDRFDGGDLDEGLAAAIAASLAVSSAVDGSAVDIDLASGSALAEAAELTEEAEMLRQAMQLSVASSTLGGGGHGIGFGSAVTPEERAIQEAMEASRREFEARQAEEASRQAAARLEEEAALRAAMQASVDDAMAAVKPTLTSQRLGALTADIHSAIGTRNLRAMKHARVALLTTLDGYTATAEQEENMAILMTLIDPAIAEVERHARLGATARASAVAAMGGARVRVPAQPQAAESVEEETTTSVAALIARFGGGSKAKK